MATTKVTYTLDEATVHLIEEAAKIQHKPKSQVIRDAVKDYHARIGRLSESERQRRLDAFDRLYPLIKLRTRQESDAELEEIRDPAGRAAGLHLPRTWSDRSRHLAAGRCGDGVE